MSKPRLILADDHSLVLEGFRHLLAGEFELVAAVENGRALVEAAERLKPDVILLDISMPLLNGIDAARQLRKSLPDTKLIFLTMHSDAAYVTEAFRVGASGFLLKNSAASELSFAIWEAVRGRCYLTPMVTRNMLDVALGTVAQTVSSHFLSPDLTPRQREVLQLVAEGHSIKEIAAILDISVKTVEFHKSRLMQSLQLRTTAELTKYAIAHGLITL